jgi:RHS repeat-associated protein
MPARAGHTRLLVALLAAVIVLETGAVTPAPVFADEPTASPTPAATNPPSPTPPTERQPSPTPTTSPSPDPLSEPPADLAPPGVEQEEMRTADSRTFEQADGTFVTELFSGPIFYQPEESDDWAPIDLTFEEPPEVAGRGGEADADVEAVADDSPAQLALAAADADEGFLRLAGDGNDIRFSLPDGVAPGVAGAAPEISADGRFADYADFLPGGIGLRVFPRADGVKTFIVLHEKPEQTTFSFEIDAPGLSLAPEEDGTFVFLDAAGKSVGRIPRPFMVDSSIPQGLGSGIYSEAVTLGLAKSDNGRPLITLDIDPAFLETAVYPVYVDPSTIDFPTGSTTANDTFASSKYPNSTFGSYQRPDPPGYRELWHGKEPGAPYYSEIYIRFNSLAETLGSVHIDAASLQMYPYHQYYDSTPRPTWVRRVSQTWGPNELTWNNRPNTDAELGQFNTSEDVWSNINVKGYVQDVINGTANHGLMLHANDTGQGNWKRFISRNDPSTYKPKLVVTWHVPSAVPAAPTANAWGNRTVSWTYDDGTTTANYPQSHYQVQVAATSGGFATPLRDSGWVAGSGASGTFPASGGAMTEGSSYWWRVRVKDGFGSSAWSSAAQFKLDTVAPTADFSTPNEGTTAIQTATSYTVGWTDSGTGSAVASRSLQRQRGSVVTAGTCTSVIWSNDGSTVTSVSPVTASGLISGYCYRWLQTVTDQAANTVTQTSGSVLVAPAAPVVTWMQPATGSPASQGSTNATLAWTENAAGSGVASRSLQRQRGTVANAGTCTGVTWANDGAPVVEPVGFVAGASAQTWWAISSQPVTTPAAVQPGDQLVALVVIGRDGRTANPGQTTVTPPAGWTQRDRRDYLTDGAPSEYLLYEKVATAADSGSQTWAVSPTRGFGVYVAAYRGLRYTSYSGPSTRTDTQTPAAEITLPNVTLTRGQYAVGVIGSGYWQGQWFAAVPAGWTQRLAMAASYYQQSGFLERYSALGETVTGPTVAISTTHGAHRRVAWSVVLRPALSAPVPVTQTGLSSGYCYRWMQTLTDGLGTSGSATSGMLLVDTNLDNGRRGEESYYTRVPFDLGGGWRMAVGVANGELTLDRHLFEIPSYGPPQSLSLSYSSLNPTAGYLGTGWSSNLTQSLSFSTGYVHWNRADGGVLPFTLVGSTWTPLAGHHETLVYDSASARYVLTLKDQTKLFFEGTAPGRLVRIENRFGKALALAWNTGSATATDPSGRVTNLTISSGRITQATDSAGRSWSFGYTSNNLTSVTDPAGKVTTLAYGTGGLTSVSRTRSRVSGSPETITWSVAYSGGKVSAVTDPVNASVANTLTYATNQTTVGLLKTSSPLVRNTWVYTLDELGRVTHALDPAGYTTGYTYDSNSNLTQLMLPIKSGPPAVNQTISYTYDARGNVLSETTQLSATQNVVTVMTYNATNDLLTRSEADNDAALKLVTRQTYDGAGHLTSVNVNCTTSGTTPPASAGTCTGAGTQNSSTNLITSFTYTANHQLETETDPLGRVTKHVYDTYGNETSTIQNFISGQSETADRNVTTTVAFNQSTTAGKAGLPTSMTDPVGNTTAYTYDALSRQTTESFPGDSSIPALNRTTTYDELGNVLTETDAWTGASRVTSHVYDKANRGTSMTDPVGVTNSTAYDAAGNANAMTAGGVTTSRTFDGLGRVITESVAAAVTTRSYDGQGREKEIVDAEGLSTVSTHDLAGRLLAETVDPGGAALETSHAYDRLGRLVSTTAPGSSTTTTAYDRPGRVTSTTEASASTSFTYDRAGNQTSAVAPDGTVTATVVDALNRATIVVANDVTSPTEPTEDVTTTTYYDAAGQTVAVKDAHGVTGRSMPNVRGQVMKAIANCTDSGTAPPSNPATCTGNGTHDATTNIVRTTIFDGSGASTLVVVAQGTAEQATIEKAYDTAGRRIAVKDPIGTVTRTLYDGAGRASSTIVNCTNDTTNPSPPAANWWTCSGSSLHDGTWNVTSSRTYDSRGNVATETAPNGRVTRYLYDDADRLIQRTDNYVTGTPASADQNVSTFFAYDDAGRPTAVRTPTLDRNTFSVTRLVYDEDGRLAKDIRNCTDSGTTPPGDPAWKTCAGNGTKNASTNLITQYGYDERGNRVAVIAPDPSATIGTSTATVTTRYAFDTDNRLCRVLENATVDLASLADPCTTPVSGTTTQNVSTRYTYDGLGNMSSMIDARLPTGSTTLYGYDEAGRMISLTDPVGKTTSWAYDDLGRRTSRSERGTSTTLVSWTYDAAGRMKTRQAGGATTSYEYDLSGNRELATSPGSSISTTFDRLNRPVSASVSGDSAATTTYTYSLTSPSWTDPSGSYGATLDKFDRQISLTDPIHSSSTFDWFYRADGQPASMSAPNGNVTAFTYDAAGSLASKVTTGTGGASRASYGFSRNRAGQIVSEASTISGDPTNGTTGYEYDQLGRLTGFDRAAVSTGYGWQEAPNRSSVQVGADPALTTTFNAANRPTTDSAGGSYSHDDEGRLTARPGQTLEWDALGRLSAVRDSSNNALIAAYTYDALDRLLVVDHGGSDRIRFRYVALTTEVAQVVNDTTGTVIRSIANDWTGTRLLDWTGSGSNQRFDGTNSHHDVTWTANDSGAVSATLRYDPWGNLADSTGTSLPEFRFQGSWFDTASNLQWVVTRWYGPTLGRFISEDTLLGVPIQPASRHLYAYAEGEPINGYDPRGTFRTETDGGGRDSEIWLPSDEPARQWRSLPGMTRIVDNTAIAQFVFGVAAQGLCFVGGTVTLVGGAGCAIGVFMISDLWSKAAVHRITRETARYSVRDQGYGAYRAAEKGLKTIITLKDGTERILYRFAPYPSWLQISHYPKTELAYKWFDRCRSGFGQFLNSCATGRTSYYEAKSFRPWTDPPFKYGYVWRSLKWPQYSQ